MSAPPPSPPPASGLCMAPLRGVTVSTFRAVFARHFTAPERAIAPFIPTIAGDRIKPTLLKDVARTEQSDLRIIPQVIGKDPEQLAAMLRALRDLGHTEVNLNAGCPWKFVARKGRGAGLLADADALRRMLDAGCAALPEGFSIKVRLGVNAPDTLAQRVPLLNEYPLREVIVHPRTAAQMYGGQVLLEAFETVYREIRAPVTYNGDLYTPADLAALRQRFPSVTRWMIGRGLVADPFLPAAIRAFERDGRIPPDPGTAGALRAFHDELYARYRAELYGPAPVLGRMKELWGYLHERCEDGATLLRAIQRCRSTAEYEALVEGWFRQVGRLRAIRPRIGNRPDPRGTEDLHLPMVPKSR